MIWRAFFVLLVLAVWGPIFWHLIQDARPVTLADQRSVMECVQRGGYPVTTTGGHFRECRILIGN